jgi:hypothetical protein
MTRKHRHVAAALALCLLVSGALAQRGFRSSAPDPDQPLAGEPREWTFARLAYGGGYGGSRWATDYPRAEYHFSEAVRRLTRLDVYPDGHVVSPDSDQLFDYPWLYAVEVGQWYLDEDEAKLLREYLDRGGFLMVDDFWGEYEWGIFVDSMRRVFPDRRIQELGEDHELLHVLYDLDQRTQIPGINGQRAGTVPHWRGIFDDDHRLMVAINFNMDMGDAWEHADDPYYPEPMTALAYRFAVNYLIYSMTH